MDLSKLYWFVKVVETGSMTGAARLGGCAVSSISDSIRQLEESLNVRLLERSTRRLRLTEAGEVFYERARLAVESAEAARLAVESWHDEPAGLLTISAAPELTRSAIVPALKLMRESYPKVRIRVLLTTERSDLLRENIDLAVRAGELNDSQLVARKLTDMSLHLVATREFLAAQGPVTHPHDLERVPCIAILSLVSNKVWPWLLAKEGETVSVTPDGGLEVSSVGAGMDLALAGMGIALVSNLILDADYRERLSLVLPDWQLPAAPLWAVYPSKSHLSPKVRVFVEILQETLEQRCIGDAHDLETPA